MATISIADDDARVQYTQAVNGIDNDPSPAATELTIDFPFFDLDDIEVIKTTAAGVDTVLSRGTGTGTFTVTGTAVDDGFSGGNIKLHDTDSATDTTYTIYRDIAVTRTTDFPTSGPFNVSALNTELDRIIAIEQELETKITRTLRLAESDATADVSLPNLDTRKGKTLAFNATTGAVEAGPSVAGVTTVGALAADIATLADIEDGTVATNAITGTAAIASNVTTVAGISSNVSTVAGISSDVTAVAADATDIGTVATNIASVNTVATNIADVITVANDLNEAISEIETAADDLNEAVSEIDTVAQNIANVNAVGTIDTDVTTVAGIAANVTTTAGISGDVTTVAGIAPNVTTVAGVSANVTTVAGVSADVTTVAGISSDVTTAATNNANITTVAGAISNVNAVGTDIANVNTVASNLTDINAFADTYFISATAPASPTTGDLWFDTANSIMKVYDGSGWVNAGSSVNGTSERQTYTATAGQTTFSATYDAGYVDVYLNGIKLIDGTDFTATNGSSIVLTTGAALNDTVDIVAYGTFSLLSTSINDLNDVNTTGVTNGQVLTYNSTSGNFEPQAPSSGGLTDVVNDTTPQLGGNLDLNSNNITGTGQINTSGDVTISTDNFTVVTGATPQVGIGTASPKRKLEVYGSNSTGAEISLTNTSMSTDRRTMNFFMTSDKAGWRMLNDAQTAGSPSVTLDWNGNLDATSFTGDGSGLTNVGTILQFVSTELASGIQLQSSGAFHELTTSLRLSITPVSASSTLILKCYAPFVYPNSAQLSYAYFYNVTAGAPVSLASANPSRTAVAWHKRTRPFDINDMDIMDFMQLTPSGSTTARTYTIWHKTEGAVAQFLNSTLSSSAGTNTKIFFTITEVA